MIKPLPVVFAALTLAGAVQLAALEIVSPFKPIGPVDPALLIDPAKTPVAAAAFEGRLVDLAGEPVAGGEVVLRWVYPPPETEIPESDPEMAAEEATEEGSEEIAETPVEPEEPAEAAAEEPAEEPADDGGADEPYYEYTEVAVSRHARSDARGFFQLADIDPDQWLTLEVAAPGYVRRSIDLGLLSEGHFLRVFELERGGSLVFEVLDEKGEKLPTARVSVVPPGESYLIGIPLISDPTAEDWIAPRGDGAFHLDGLAAGVLNLVVASPGYRSQVVSVDVPQRREPLHHGKIQLEPAGSLRGRVVNPDGEPVADASVQVHLTVGVEVDPSFLVGEMVLSDENGKFELADRLPAGLDFALVATAEGYGFTRMEWSGKNKGPIELRLKGRRQIYGQVVFKEDRAPVADCELFTSLEGADAGIGDMDSATSDAGGHFELAQAPGGPFTINFSCGEKFLNVAVGAEVELPLVLEVPRGTFLRGQVIREDEDSEDLISVVFGDRSGDVDPEGHFALEGVEPGSGQLWVSCGEIGVTYPLEVPKEGLEGVTVRLPKAGSLSRLKGRVFDPKGKPAASAWVQVYSKDAVLLATAMTLPDGTFETSGLVRGSWQVVCQWEERYFSLPFEGKEEEQTLELNFPGGSTVRGRVQGLAGSEAGRLAVRASRQIAGAGNETLKEVLKAKVDASGHFEFENVPEGEWQVRATVFGRQESATAQVEVGSQGFRTVDLELEAP